MPTNPSENRLNPNSDWYKHYESLIPSPEDDLWELNPVLRASEVSKADMEDAESRRLLMGVQIMHQDEQIKNLQYAASHDHLTELKNGSGFMFDLSNAIKKIGEGDELVMWMMDLDNFKLVNDELGHDEGDNLLGIVGRVLGKEGNVFRRETDVVGRGSREEGDLDFGVARLHGDEFAAFSIRLKDRPEIRTATAEEEITDQSQRVNAELKAALEGTKFERFNVNISLGASPYEDGDSYQSIYARADLSMYETKYRGKVDKLTQEDKKQLANVIPFLDSINYRVPKWMREAAGLGQLSFDDLAN